MYHSIRLLTLYIKAQFVAHPMGYWTTDKGHNMRAYLEEIALNMNKDPMDPETWYSIPRSAVEETKV